MGKVIVGTVTMRHPSLEADEKRPESAAPLLAAAADYIAAAKERGCGIVCLPEYFANFNRSQESGVSGLLGVLPAWWGFLQNPEDPWPELRRLLGWHSPGGGWPKDGNRRGGDRYGRAEGGTSGKGKDF